MKPPIVDNRKRLGNKPGLHVFIVGVSGYPYLPTEDEEPEAKFGMRQLSSATLAAYNIYLWLINHQEDLALGLLTCRLLLSPSAKELSLVPELNDIAAPATLENFQSTVVQWRKDAMSRRSNMTLFYFAGHGVQKSRGQHVMLLEGFGNPDDALTLRHAVDTTELVEGMSPGGEQQDIARTQLYFIDACRIKPEKFAEYEKMPISGLWNTPPLKVDDQISIVFHTTVPGHGAYGVKGEQSVFSKALIQCLSGGAGVADRIVDSDGETRWLVTTNSINESLEYHLKKVNEKTGTNQQFSVNGIGPNVVIRRLGRPPEVDIDLWIDPAQARRNVKVEVSDDDENLIKVIPAPIDPHPYSDSLPAGTYRVGGKIDPASERYRNSRVRRFNLTPPNSEWVIRIAENTK